MIKVVVNANLRQHKIIYFAGIKMFLNIVTANALAFKAVSSI